MVKANDIAEAMGRKLTPDDPVPKMVLEDALADGVFDKVKNKRSGCRLAVEIMGEFEKECTRLCNSFFQLANDNADDEALRKFMFSLDEQWKNWLRRNFKKYHYANCKDFFATKIDYLIGERKKAAQNILKTIGKEIPENKV